MSRQTQSPTNLLTRHEAEATQSSTLRVETDDDRLTHGGVRKLHDGLSGDTVRLQVLGIYRYLADPALRDLLGEEILPLGHCDVFDVLLSDGLEKIKCILSPSLNDFVWRRHLVVLDLIKVFDMDIVYDDSENPRRRLCIIHSISAQPLRSKRKIVNPRKSPPKDPCISFLSTNHIRATSLLPLAGERMYYLPLYSDHFSVDWTSSFEDDTTREVSPTADLMQTNVTSAYDWNKTRRYCLSLFSAKVNVIHTIKEVNEMINRSKYDSATYGYPPITGVVHFKSAVMHVGDPGISNPFPFVFHVALVDRCSTMEIAFFGSMCAKYFMTIEEGDLIHLRGYSVLDSGHQTSTLTAFFNDHSSTAEVLHISEKFWKLLEMTQVIARHNDALDNSQRRNPYSQPPIWHELCFVSTLNVQYWSSRAMENLDSMHFDFIGVLSYVSKIYRRQDPRTEYRWVKVIDTSSSTELVILVEANSQPQPFYSLQAGDMVMITKLKWVVLPPWEASENADLRTIEYAMTSSISTLRVDDAVKPFATIEGCSLDGYFAQNIKDQAEIRKTDSTRESWLGGRIGAKYQPTNSLPTEMNDFVNALGIQAVSFSQLPQLCEEMEPLQHHHVGFIEQIESFRVTDGDQGTPDILIKLSHDSLLSKYLTVRVQVNPLFRTTKIAENRAEMASPESISLLHILPLIVVDDIYKNASQQALNGRERSTRSKTNQVTLEFIQDYLKNRNQSLFFSANLFKYRTGEIECGIDAILLN